MAINSCSVFFAPAVTAVLLAGITVDQFMFHLPSSSAAPYHERVRVVAQTMPYKIGNWIGTDIEVPRAAVALLRPNVLLNRHFRNRRTGQQVSLLLVQCGDARDLLGHYPPVCYVTNGWTQDSVVPRDWKVGDLAIRGVEYRFSRSTFSQSTTIVIDNFMILPDGRTARDMEAISFAAEDPRKKVFGAAQVQMVFDAGTSPDERDEIIHTFLEANMSILGTIQSGITK